MSATAGDVLGVLYRREPAAPRAPLVVDSPHSGTHYPADFRPTAPMAMLRRTEDRWVDELWGAAPRLGATLLAALFPRVYIDANRAEDDIDTSLIDGDWPGSVGGEKSARGIGLVWRRIPPHIEIYDRRLSPAEVRHRIETYWRPYHAALDDAIAAVQRTHGIVWHLNCHSMPSRGDASAGDPGRKRADFVLGDLDGASCDGAFTALVERTIKGLGYGVARNDPFKGVELVRRHGQPAAGRHSLQIEINRALYMDEASGAKLPAFGKIAEDVTRLLRLVCDHVRAEAGSFRA